MAEHRIGIIGGSGIYDLDMIAQPVWERITSPFGEASDEILLGEIDSVPIAFLTRHGRGHRLSPTDINYRANIDCLKRVGVTDILSLSACGSFREDAAPGHFVIVDQFIDRTFARQKTFFGSGIVAHVSMADPVCSRLGDVLETAAEETGISVHRGGTYLAIEGPQFSTRAESHLYRDWGCDVIGMTNMPEAKLAREAEICYATVGMVTDYDCWHPDFGEVDVADIIRVLGDNAENARELVRKAVVKLADRPAACPNGCDHALDYAIITGKAARDPDIAEKLDAIAGRVLRN